MTSNKNQQQNASQEKITATTTTATTGDNKSPKIEVTQPEQITSFPFNAQVATQQQVVMTTQQQVQPQIRVALNKTPTIPNNPG